MKHDAMTDWPRNLANSLIGVVDLKNAQAVHAVAGVRNAYQPIQLPDASSGDPFALLLFYKSFGLKQFYIADLDALMGGAMQKRLLKALVETLEKQDTLWLDCGLMLGETRDLRDFMRGFPRSRESPAIRWIVASESSRHSNCQGLHQMTKHLEHGELAIGVDLRQGVFQGPSCCSQPEPSVVPHGSFDREDLVDAAVLDWVHAGSVAGIRHGVVLDVADVGTNRGPTTLELCRNLARRFPDWDWVSGGGVRGDSDVKDWIAAGCSGVLVATALLPPQ